MGYTTTFTGELLLSRQLTDQEVQAINKFCSERHEGMKRRPGMPPDGIWCDWGTDGRSLGWNGSEKSYYMFEWLQFLLAEFLGPMGVGIAGGKIVAQGEDPSDVWAIEPCPPFPTRKVKKLRGRLEFKEDP